MRRRIFRKAHWYLMIVLGVIVVLSGLYHHTPVLLFVGAFIAAFGWSYITS